MSSYHPQGQGFPSNVKVSAPSKTPLKSTVKTPPILTTLLAPHQLQKPTRLRDLSVGSEKKGYTASLQKKILSMVEQNVKLDHFIKKGSMRKINHNIIGENDSKMNQANRVNYSIIEEDNRKVVHLRPIEHPGKNNNSFLLEARNRGNSNDPDKSTLSVNNRIRKTYLPPISMNTSILEEGNGSQIANNSIISKYQPSPYQKRIKAERANSEFNVKKILPRKLLDQSPPRKIAHTINAEKAERIINKENSNLHSTSFDQETSYEGSQKTTDRSLQHGHRRNRRRRNRSHMLEIENLFNVQSNRSLDDAYERLNQLTNRNSKAREVLLKIQESAAELKAEVNRSKNVDSMRI